LASFRRMNFVFPVFHKTTYATSRFEHSLAC
jgi:hypothetical protein